MMHAKTAVADGQWARIGSTNLNITSWLGNCELDAVIENQSFGAQMEDMYRRDLASATEVVLDMRRRVRAPGEPRHPRRATGRGSGSARVATAGALRIGNTIGAALMDRRVLGPVEARLTSVAGLLLCVLSVLVGVFPRTLAYPAVALGLWGGIALLWKGYQLRRSRKKRPRPE
jgi:cardiolipin synthase